jgi:hypothetical protein
MRLFGVGCQVPRDQPDRDGSPGLNFASRATLNGAMTNPKRPRGRPPNPQGAKPRAEVQRAYRERRKAAGKVLRVIDTWTIMTPAEIAEQGERLGNALRKLKLRKRDVQRLEARNAYLEGELRPAAQCPWATPQPATAR